MSVDLQTEYDKVYKYCYFKVRNHTVAEDLTQETFLRYFSQNSYLHRGKTLAYLYTIAKHLCVDHFRQRPTAPLDEEASGGDEMETVISNLALRQAIRCLDPELSELILLRFGSELGVSEIGTMLSLSRFAVRRKINAALSELKQLLKEDF